MENNLTKQAVEKLLNYIKDNRLKDGDSLPTVDKMEELLGVSRIVVREACSYLKGLGIISSRRGSGFKVNNIKISDALEQILTQLSFFVENSPKELLELRKIMEIGIIYDAVENATEENINEIKEKMQTLEDIVHRSSESEVYLSEYLQAELQFHSAIVKSGKSDILQILNATIKGFFKNEKRNQKISADIITKLKEDNNEHQQIVLAFIGKQPHIAQMVLRSHLSKEL